MTTQETMIDNIINILNKNGFPNKKVSLPLEKLYESADNKGLNFNNILEALKSDHQIDHEKTTEKIIFFKSHASNSNDFNLGDKASMFKKASEMMSKMSPEELQKIQDMVMNMSDEEKEEMMKKGKEMGLI